MLFRSSVALSLALSTGLASSQSTFPRGAMWIFGNHGLNIYSADGSVLLKQTPPEEICPIVDEEPNCASFSEVVSDNSKYVWTTSNSRSSGAQIEIFDIDNGEFVGAFPTCAGPRGFQFLPNRREVWFRCTAPHKDDPDGESGYWDSFSTTSISTHFPEISLSNDLPHFNETSYGIPGFLEDKGIAYSSDYSTNTIHKVDLNARVPLSNITIPLANGGWDMVYSQTNRHLFMRTYICCTCGGEDKDVENCREYRGGVHADPVMVLTGPSANPDETQIGGCGRHCDNSRADTLGVVEVDTETDSIVGYHKNHIGFGASSVYLSPNGQYIVLVSTQNAPGNIRLLLPGANGAKSTFYKDIGLPTESRLGAHAFITSDVIAIPGSGDENELYLAEISTGKVHTVKLDSASVSTGSSSGRKVQYIPGSPYLWVTANGAEEDADRFAYVVGIDFMDWSKTKVLRKVTSIDVNGMLFVENMNLARDVENQVDGVQRQVEDEVTSLEVEVQQLRSQMAAVSIIALVVAVLALGLALAGFYKMASQNQKNASSSGSKATNSVSTSSNNGEDYPARPNPENFI